MTDYNHQLNILEIMGLKRSHYHRSKDSTSANDITIPTVDAYQQYNSPTITRVTKQFAKNIERLVSYIKENHNELHTTNLSNYITTNTEDNDGLNKIFVSAPCAMTSERTYRNALSTAKALEIIQSEAGIKWDPELVEVLVDIKNK
jgi:hypothetical protein